MTQEQSGSLWNQWQLSLNLPQHSFMYSLVNQQVPAGIRQSLSQQSMGQSRKNNRQVSSIRKEKQFKVLKFKATWKENSDRGRNLTWQLNRRHNKDDTYDEIMFCFLAIHIGSLPHGIGKTWRFGIVSLSSGSSRCHGNFLFRNNKSFGSFTFKIVAD